MKKTILIVEDNKLYRKILEKILPRQYPCFRFLFARSFDTAQQKAKNLTDLDWLITDYQLGTRDAEGIRLAKEIKNKFQNIKIILLSSFIDNTQRKETLQQGIDHFASKLDGLDGWIKLIT